MSKLVKQSISDIKKIIKKDNHVYWFLIKNKKALLICKGMTKTEANNCLIDKIDDKLDKYINARLWRLTITTHNAKLDRKNNPVFGDVRIMVENYIVNERKKDLQLKKIIEKGHSGPIWIQKEWLEYNTWKKAYINNIINKVSTDTVKLKVTGQNFYRMYFE
jgi:hypothetical protein